jgi:hypothetical protein
MMNFGSIEELDAIIARDELRGFDTRALRIIRRSRIYKAIARETNRTPARVRVRPVTNSLLPSASLAP